MIKGKLIFSASIIVLLTGCCEKETVYTDINGSVKQLEITPEIRCDSRGYAYYESASLSGQRYSLTPILANGDYGTYQVKCKNLW